MGFLSRGKTKTPATAIQPTVDWTDLANIRAEWGFLEPPGQAMEGWSNGMRMSEEEWPPAQNLNIAEYMTRALGHEIVGRPLLDDARTAETCRRVLRKVEEISRDEPDFVFEFAPRISRLALAVTRERGWQPPALGGDGTVSGPIEAADPDWIVWNSVRCPGVTTDAVMTHFFGVATPA